MSRILRTAAVSLVLCFLIACTFTATPRAADDGDIKVHGHWTIELVNPDGALASRHDFENALFSNGGVYLVGLLAGLHPARSWTVRLAGTPGSSPCGTGLSTCDLTGADLSVSVPVTGPNAFKLILSGTTTAVRDGTIDYVQSVQNGGEILNPSNQTTVITSKVLSSSIAVVSGQQIRVTVAISFS